MTSATTSCGAGRASTASNTSQRPDRLRVAPRCSRPRSAPGYIEQGFHLRTWHAKHHHPSMIWENVLAAADATADNREQPEQDTT